MKISQKNLAAQLYTLREFTKTPKDIAETMKKVKQIGYDAVQISALGPIDPKELAAILDGEGLVSTKPMNSSKNSMPSSARTPPIPGRTQARKRKRNGSRSQSVLTPSAPNSAKPESPSAITTTTSNSQNTTAEPRSTSSIRPPAPTTSKANPIRTGFSSAAQIRSRGAVSSPAVSPCST